MVKVRMTVTVEYEADPEWYYEGITPQQILEEDLEAFKEDFSLLVSTLEDNEINIIGELVE